MKISPKTAQLHAKGKLIIKLPDGKTVAAVVKRAIPIFNVEIDALIHHTAAVDGSVESAEKALETICKELERIRRRGESRFV